MTCIVYACRVKLTDIVVNVVSFATEKLKLDFPIRSSWLLCSCRLAKTIGDRFKMEANR